MASATDDHTERILRAAVAFVRAMHLPDDHETRLAECEEQQTAALAALVAAVERDVVRKEAVNATDS
jgi:hypothetical protein